MILLRPYILGYKNRISRSISGGRWFGMDFVMAASLLVVIYAIYWATVLMLESLQLRSQIDGNLIFRSASMALFGFGFLLTFSSFLSALGAFFASQDLPLILVAPIRRSTFFVSKFTETLISAAWLFLFLFLPVLVGVCVAFDLPWYYVVDSLFLLLVFATIPTSFGVLGAMVFVNYFPIARLGDIVVIFILSAVLVFFVIGDGGLLAEVPRSFSSMNGMDSAVVDAPYLPSAWAALLIVRGLPGTAAGGMLYLQFLGFAAGVVFFTYWIFTLIYHRGYATALESNARTRVTALAIHLPFRDGGKPRPVRTMIQKEAKLFFRDTTQALQLALILVLTLVYLYNFRSLQALSQLTPEAQRWWSALLNTANIFMGASVSSAIATRFVFPAVSLEGRAYHLIRMTPLSISEFVRAKFLAWFIPVAILTLVLLVSGAFAIQASIAAVLVTAVIAVALSGGVVALGIGSGAMYARFDWDSPHQIFSHFGSLVYMLLSIGIIILSLVPASYLFILLAVPELFQNAAPGSYSFSVFCSLFLIVFINAVTVSSCLRSAENSLQELERD